MFFLSSSYSYVKCMKMIKNTSWCHLSLVTLVSVTAVSFLSWLIHEPYLHLLPSYSFGLPGSPPPLHKLWCQTFFFVPSISATVHVSGDTELISSVTGAWALLFSFPFLPLSFQRKHCGKLNLLWHYFLIFFFCQKFSCTERSKVNVSLFREMEVLQIVSQSLI